MSVGVISKSLSHTVQVSHAVFQNHALVKKKT